MKKWISVLMVAVLMLTGITALAEKVIVGTNAEFPPFEYFADDGSIEGFDVELITAILAVHGMEVELTHMDFDALPAALAAGKVDVAIAGLTISEEKSQSVLFSEPYFQATQKLIVVADSAIASEADVLAGMKVGVQLGTTGDTYVTDNLPAECVRYNRALDAVWDLKNGRIDAVMVDAAPSEYFVQAVEGLKVLDENLSDEQYGIAVKLGNDEMMVKLNEGLASVKENGTYDALYEKYFGKIEAE